jgi:hypothetical protein
VADRHPSALVTNGVIVPPVIVAVARPFISRPIERPVTHSDEFRVA